MFQIIESLETGLLGVWGLKYLSMRTLVSRNVQWFLAAGLPRDTVQNRTVWTASVASGWGVPHCMPWRVVVVGVVVLRAIANANMNAMVDYSLVTEMVFC